MEEELWLLIVSLGAGGVLGATNRRAMKALAFGYVVATEAIGNMVGPIQENWQRAVEEAREERAREAAQQGQSPRRVRGRQRQGERAVKQSAAAAGEVGAQAATTAV